MVSTIEYIIEKISSIHILHGKKLRKTIDLTNIEYLNRANIFLNRYVELLKSENRTIDFAIDCYMKMLADVNFESVQFQKTGRYSSTSFNEVNQRVYNNPEIMEYYMYGLLLSQFLWKHHFDVLLWFNQIILKNKSDIKNYLEIGGGHGLYISEAIKIIGNITSFEVVDISESSIAITKKMIDNQLVNFHLTDIYNFDESNKYDFITMGEVLEHVEDPVSLLKKIGTLLKDDGKLFITTPTNAPAIDHIFLFNNVDEIRKIILKAGLNIMEELAIPTENLSAEQIERFKISTLYACVLTK